MQSILFPVVLSALVFLFFLATLFIFSQIVVINMTPHSNGMGNHMFRFAAGMGLAERGFDVCWSNYSWDRLSPPMHPNSFFFQHVDDPHVIPQCSMLTGVMALVMLPRFSPPFSTYVPFEQSNLAVLVDGAMESFRYFPKQAPRPLFNLKQRLAAEVWMRDRNLTSAIHVRRGDYAAKSPPYEFYARTRIPYGAVVVTDDPEWVLSHPSVFGNATVSLHHDPGFDMALLAAATDTVVIGIGTFAWWGAYLSSARRVFFYGDQAGSESDCYNEEDRMPGQWVKVDVKRGL